MPAPHPPEFRRRAVELARERTKPVAELTKELRISESCLRNWMAQADVDDSGSDIAPTSKEKKEQNWDIDLGPPPTNPYRRIDANPDHLLAVSYLAAVGFAAAAAQLSTAAATTRTISGRTQR